MVKMASMAGGQHGFSSTLRNLLKSVNARGIQKYDPVDLPDRSSKTRPAASAGYQSGFTAARSMNPCAREKQPARVYT
jgi:hypothetical protein